MSLSVCPFAFVRSSADNVWAHLAEPARYAEWWDFITDSVVPAGPAQPGQQIAAHTRAFLGKSWRMRIVVESVNAGERELRLTTSLPFGITVLNHITVIPVDESESRVSFG